MVRLVLCLLFVACANIGTPDGGLYDEDPPRILHTTPRYGSTNAMPKKITLDFDENIKLEGAAEKVVISPPQFEMPEIEASGKKVTVTLLDTLKPNFTYTIDFGSSIVDNNEGNPMGEYAFTFSTGGDIDTLQVSGYVLNAENLEPIKGILVGLYRMSETADTVLSSQNPPPPSAERDSILQALHVEREMTISQKGEDSTFRSMPLERIGRTDGSGHFIVKGVAPGTYRIFALGDQDQTYTYSQRSEALAFTERIITPYAKLETRMDTLWHDSIHYDSIYPVKFTHFYPDDIVLTAFTHVNQDRYLLKSERPELHKFTLFFTAPSDTLPRLTPLNFSMPDSTYVVEATGKNDTLTYWITDSLIYNIDTLTFLLDYYATDTLGQLSLRTDTLELFSKLSKERMAKQRAQAQAEWEKEYRKKVKTERKAKQAEEEAKEREAEEAERKQAEAEGRKYEKKKKEKKKKSKDDEDEELVIPPMPSPSLEMKVNNATGLSPDKNIDFIFDEPVLQLDTTLVHFSLKVDTLFVPAPYILRRMDGTVNRYRLYAEWEPDSTYQLELDSAAFVSIYGKASEATKRSIKVKGLDAFSTLFVTLQGADTTAVVQLLNGQDKVVKTERATNGKADFYFIQPQTYYLRMFYDLNSNGLWDTGDYDQRLQPEPVFYYPQELLLRAQWDVTQTWNPTARPLSQQKPEKITKQKADKQKQIQNRNAQKLAERARRKKK